MEPSRKSHAIELSYSGGAMPDDTNEGVADWSSIYIKARVSTEVRNAEMPSLNAKKINVIMTVCASGVSNKSYNNWPV